MTAAVRVCPPLLCDCVSDSLYRLVICAAARAGDVSEWGRRDGAHRERESDDENRTISIIDLGALLGARVRSLTDLCSSR